MITKLNIRYDPKRLWYECLDFVGRYGWGAANQICLTHRPETINPIERAFEGAGSLRKTKLKESQFTVLNEECTPYLIEVYHSLGSIGRLRIMRMRGRTCYSVHRDATKRVHLPLITNSQALMIFPRHSLIVQLPADGQAYLIDTTLYHTALNGSLDDRVHLVGALCE